MNISYAYPHINIKFISRAQFQVELNVRMYVSLTVIYKNSHVDDQTQS